MTGKLENLIQLQKIYILEITEMINEIRKSLNEDYKIIYWGTEVGNLGSENKTNLTVIIQVDMPTSDEVYD